MPPLALLSRPRLSTGRKAAMLGCAATWWCRWSC